MKKRFKINKIKLTYNKLKVKLSNLNELQNTVKKVIIVNIHFLEIKSKNRHKSRELER